MHRILLSLVLVAATAVTGFSPHLHQALDFLDSSSSSSPTILEVPFLRVPACPDTGNITYTNSVPSSDTDPFPETRVAVCYDDLSIHIAFTALEETSFFYNASIPENGNIYDYEVMEAFIYRGVNDPQNYLEFEVAPNNQTFSAWIYNPSKVRAAGAVFTRAYVTDPVAQGLTAATTLYPDEETWVSAVQVPLGLFNVDAGTARGTRWRMNFFRTVTSASAFPTQLYGAWSAPNETNFHMTPFFGHVDFV